MGKYRTFGDEVKYDPENDPFCRLVEQQSGPKPGDPFKLADSGSRRGLLKDLTPLKGKPRYGQLNWFNPARAK